MTFRLKYILKGYSLGVEGNVTLSEVEGNVTLSEVEGGRWDLCFDSAQHDKAAPLSMAKRLCSAWQSGSAQHGKAALLSMAKRLCLCNSILISDHQ
ncbi:hypothetical protein I5M32_00960 [Pedobacter sp. SD-b]|uniref:Immunity protein 74 n=1 Tax=Pedobacter segetis TaxID=2793069 RepID=A0ABS1BF87_9SPHI|nr:hypothetical protein [Pedobacter segetis]MBK0381515.1 hypothetical protein [Pedobacter segetis]